MKTKFFFLFLVLICAIVTLPAFGQKQYTDEQIRVGQLVLKNKINNPMIMNSDSIWPGQLLFYQIGNHDTLIWVKPGDTQEGIIAGIVKNNQAVVPLDELGQDESDQGDYFEKRFPNDFLTILLALLIIAAVYGLYKFLKPAKKKEEKTEEIKFSEDPTKEGPAIAENGIHSDEEANRHFVALAKRDNPNINPSQIVVTDRKRVYVSTPDGEAANVDFVDGTTQELAFRNIPGWQAMVSTDGGKSFQREVFFQDCGNPVYNRTSMKDSGLIITDEPIHFGDQPVVEKQAEASESFREIKEATEDLKKALKEIEEENLDVATVSEDQAGVAQEFLKTQKAHKATMRYEKKPDGSVLVETILETKNEPVAGKV